MYTAHPDIVPIDDDAVIWRYMDFAKFAAFIVESSLYFSCAKELSDHFEGSYTIGNLIQEHLQYPNNPQSVIDGSDEHRSRCFINCWHISPHESHAMWRIYSKMDQGIAIKSTFKKFKECFQNVEKQIFIGKVQYISEDPLPNHDKMLTFFYKQNMYSYEQELRALIEIESEGAKGYSVPINIDDLVSEFILSPDNPWQSVIACFLDKYEIQAPCNVSTFTCQPIY